MSRQTQPQIQQVKQPQQSSIKVWIGIDPGKRGGIAVISQQEDATEVFAWPLSGLTGKQIWRYIEQFKPGLYRYRVFACLEKVGGFIGNEAGESGPKENKAAAHITFRFGHSAGMLEGFLIAAGIPYQLVLPKEWQKASRVPARTRNESKQAYKTRLKKRAQTLYPKLKVTLATADALLLATYAQTLYS